MIRRIPAIAATVVLSALVAACQYPTRDYDRKMAEAAATSARPAARGVHGAPLTGYNTKLDEKVLVVHFRTGKVDPGYEEMDRLRAFVEETAADPNVRYDVEGYADVRGSADVNETLSQARAEFVKQAMIERGVDAWRVSSRSWGERRPNGAGRDVLARSRRVVVTARPHLDTNVTYPKDQTTLPK